MQRRVMEFLVGLFMIAALIGLLVLAFRVSGLTNFGNGSYYTLNAEFDNIGDLKVRAPVSIAGVKVGRVQAINLDRKTFRARVIMTIHKDTARLPTDSAASILTQGLLGSNYISLTPGFETKTLSPGAYVQTTHSALILENLVGQLMYNLKGDKKDN